MESQRLRDLTERLLNQIALINGFTKPRLAFSDAVKKADNFVGQVYHFAVTDEGDSNRQLAVVVKLPPANEERRKAIHADDFFRAEVYMYDKVLPALTNYYNKKKSISKDKMFPCFPRTYALLDEEDDKIIIMEDLKSKNFAMKDKLVGLDEAHCRLVLSSLARFHATSLALQRDDPQLHDNLTDNLKEIIFRRDKISEHFRVAIKNFRDIIDDPFPLGSSIRNKIESFLENYQSNMKKTVSRNSTLSCITHGDLWTNNILFKYKEGLDAPQELCFVDLQVSRMATPVTDLVNFLTFCPADETRHSFMELVKYYHKCLCSFLTDLGHDPEKIVPWSLFKEELRKYGSYGWAISIVVVPVMNLEVEDVELLEKRFNEHHVHMHHNIKKKNSDKIKKRFVEVLEQADQLGFL